MLTRFGWFTRLFSGCFCKLMNATDARTLFYTTERLGPTRELTPERFLLCKDVPIARTGFQLYGGSETPVPAGPNGITKIWRREKEVFRAETIASFQGKPVVNDHPDEDVDLTNWRELTMGIVINPRRGTGENDDVLIADLLITDAGAIQLILDGKKEEVSCGYQATYRAYEDELGEGEQVNILGNHVALVERGRCGPRCSIGDSTPPAKKTCKGARKMANGVIDKLVKALSRPSVAKALDEEMGEEFTGDEHNNIHFHLAHREGGSEGEKSTTGDRMKWSDKALDEKFEAMEKGRQDDTKSILDSIAKMGDKARDAKEDEEEEGKKAEAKDVEGELEEEAPEGTSDKARSAKDSIYLVDAYRDTVSMAAIIAPEMQIRVADADPKAAPKRTLDAICALRRSALDAALKDEDTASIITTVRGRALDSARLKKLACGDVRYLFRSVGAIKQGQNTSSVRDSVYAPSHSDSGFIEYMAPNTRESVADVNKRNAEFYAAK